MHEKIADFLRSRKGRDLILVCTILVLAALSFGLGRLSATPLTRAPVTLYIPDTSSRPQTTATAATPNALEASHPTAAVHTDTYVASRNGSVYHLPWCSGAKRINEENKVWFTSKEEAASAGYRPAANCKGI